MELSIFEEKPKMNQLSDHHLPYWSKKEKWKKGYDFMVNQIPFQKTESHERESRRREGEGGNVLKKEVYNPQKSKSKDNRTKKEGNPTKDLLIHSPLLSTHKV